MSFFEKFGKSAFELKSIRCITVTGVLIALDLVLKLVSIKITDNLKITFAFLALATIGMLFGPTVSFLAGVITDLIGFIISPEGGFSPLFTLIEAVGAMIYGIFLYEISLPMRTSDRAAKRNLFFNSLKIVLSKVTVVIVCNLIMTPIAFVMSGYMTWESMIAAYPVRLLKNVIQCPVDCVLMLVILFPILAAYKRIFGDSNNTLT